MSLIHSENFDGLTPPALPSGWNFGTGYVSTALELGVTPTSSPNMLANPPASTTTYFGTYATADTNSGNVIVQANVNFFSAASPGPRVGLTARGTASTLNLSSTSNYSAWIDFNAGSAGISKIVSGTETTLGSVSTTFSATWYTVIFTLNGTSLELAVQRVSDGYWLSASSGFQPIMVTAQYVTNSVLTSAGYAGVVVEQASTTGSTAFWDDWSFTAITAASIPPNRPVIVQIPAAFLPANQF
jgi:hypothetical protein